MAINYWFNTSLDQWTKDRQQYKDTKKKEAAQRAEAQRQAQWDVLFDCALNSTDTKTIQQYTSASNLNDLAVSIGKWINETTWKTLKPWLKDNDIVCSYLNKYPEKERDVNNYLSNKITLEEAQNKLGLYKTIPNENQYIESDTTADKAKRWWAWILWAWTVATALDGGTNLLWRWMSWYGNRMLEKDRQFLPTQKVADYQIEFGGSKRLYEDDLKTYQDELKRVQSEWWDITEIEKKIKDTEKAIKNLEANKAPRTISDTAKAYGLWSYSNKTLTERWAAEEAAKIQKKIFRDYFMPILKWDSKKINVQKIVDSLGDVVENIVDPWLQSEAFDALEALKEEYQGDRFKSMPAEKIQTLKTDLTSTLPEKTWKWKTITNQYKNLKAELASRIRKAELNIINDAIKNKKVPDIDIFKWKNAQEIFFDYVNLWEIKDRWAKSLTKPTEFPEVIGKTPVLWELTSPVWDARTPVSRWIAQKLIKWWDALKNNTRWAWAKKLFKQFSETLWKIGRASKVEDPAWILWLMQLYFEWMDSLAWKIAWKENVWWYWKEVSDIIETMPVMQVENAISEMEDFYSTWDYMTDDARVQTIVDMWKELWKDVDFEDAKYSYEKWKWESWWGARKLFFGDGNFPLYEAADDINQNFMPNENIPEWAYKWLYQQAKTDEEKIQLIMKRYWVDRAKAEEMLPRMTTAWEYNTEYIQTGEAFPSGIYQKSMEA